MIWCPSAIDQDVHLTRLGLHASACLSMFSFQLNSVRFLSHVIINVTEILYILLMEVPMCVTVVLVRRGLGVFLALV